MSAPLAESLAYLKWSFVAEAVLQIYFENKADHQKNGDAISHAADTWAIRSDLRKSTHKRAALIWAGIARLNGVQSTPGVPITPEEFPYTRDQVARLYMKYRKRDDKERAAFYKELQAVNGTPPLFQ